MYLVPAVIREIAAAAQFPVSPPFPQICHRAGRRSARWHIICAAGAQTKHSRLPRLAVASCNVPGGGTEGEGSAGERSGGLHTIGSWNWRCSQIERLWHALEK